MVETDASGTMAVGALPDVSRTRAKKSFTLSADALNILTEFQKKANAASLSAALETLLQAHQEGGNLADLDASVASYYDACTPGEATEHEEWGAFASAQLLRNLETDGR